MVHTNDEGMIVHMIASSSITNKRHSVSVSAWIDNGEQFVEMTVDGRVLTVESLGPVES